MNAWLLNPNLSLKDVEQLCREREEAVDRLLATFQKNFEAIGKGRPRHEEFEMKMDYFTHCWPLIMQRAFL